MSLYKEFTNDDVVSDVAVVTSGVFQDGASKITTFFNNSTQSGSTGDYSLDVYRYNPTGNASASVQFGVAYGHYAGSGSLGGVGVSGERPSAAVYGQFNNLINPPQTDKFKFDSYSADDIFVLSFNRARIRESLEPGGWELHLSASAGTDNLVKLIDDSSTNEGGNTSRRNFAPEYNVVSGSLVGGTTIKDTASVDALSGSYGVFYPTLGVIVLNSNRLESPGELGLSISTASNTLGGNARKFFDSVKLGKYFQAKRQEQITSRHYFVRATANDFNATTNETFYTESVAGVKRIISGLQSDPKTFITTVGMYNSDNELLAIAKLSKPIIKSRAREALIKVKLDF
tara:strand:- start:1392 stop:2423 length:1032 start_codon:yes stop_codon:yes gene_type:complete